MRLSSGTAARALRGAVVGALALACVGAGAGQVPDHRAHAVAAPGPGASTAVLGKAGLDETGIDEAGLTTDYHTLTLPTASLTRATIKGRALRGSSNSYKFVATVNRRPVRWNPCRLIPYRINPAGMTRNDVLEVRAAFRRISEASGLAFAFRGTTTWYYDQAERTGRQPSGSKLVFSFAQNKVERYAPREFADLSILGIGGPAWDRTGQIRQGMVLINRAAIKRLPTGTGPGTRMQVYVHEVGHAVGLDHVNQTDQLMFPYFNRNLPPVLGAGDTNGLRRLGKPAGCLPG